MPLLISVNIFKIKFVFALDAVMRIKFGNGNMQKFLSELPF